MGTTFGRATFALCAVALLAGCSENLQSIYRTVELEKGKGPSIIVGAKQRVVTNIDIVNASVPGQVLPKRIVCAEPSPDVGQSVSQAVQAGFEAASKSGDKVSGNFGFSLASSVVQLGERLAVIQLLRDELYRACEAYANGAINATGYTIKMSRLSKQIVTMLSSEMAAGAFGRALAATSGRAGTGGRAEIAEAREKLDNAVAEYRNAADALSVAEEADRKAAKERYDAAKEALETTAIWLVESEAQAAGGTFVSQTAGTGGSQSIGQISGARPTGVASELARIHRQFIEDDDTVSTLLDACITAADYARFSITTANDTHIKNLFSLLNGANSAFHKSRASALTAVKESARKKNAKDAAAQLEKIQSIRREIVSAMISMDSLPFQAFCIDEFLPSLKDEMAKIFERQNQLRKLEVMAGRLVSIEKILEICTKEENKDLPLCKSALKLAMGGN